MQGSHCQASLARHIHRFIRESGSFEMIPSPTLLTSGSIQVAYVVGSDHNHSTRSRNMSAVLHYNYYFECIALVGNSRSPARYGVQRVKIQTGRWRPLGHWLQRLSRPRVKQMRRISSNCRPLAWLTIALPIHQRCRQSHGRPPVIA